MYDQAQTINQAILVALESYAQKPCFKIKKRGHYRDTSYTEFQGMTFRLVRFLQSRGVANGERVVIAAHNSLDWMVCCVATLLVGGAVVPLHPSSPMEMVRFTLRDSAARLILLDDEAFVQDCLTHIEKASLPHLKTILTTTKPPTVSSNVITMAKILAETRLTAPEIQALRRQAHQVVPETMALIHYTSGETGHPKGAVFDQGRLLKMMQHMAEWFHLERHDVLFTILTWSYSSSLRAGLYSLLSGAANALMGSYQTIAEDMQQTSPVATINMPFFFEQFYEEVMTDFLNDLPEASRDVFQWAIGKGKEFLAAGPDIPETTLAELREAYIRADKTFFTKIRGVIGGRMRYLYSTGAPLPQTLADFFEVIGLIPLNIYNLAEAGAFPAVSYPAQRRPGSCGQIAPGFELRIAEDGEILIRSPMMMRDYWQRPEDTAQVIDPEGWLHSGDIGHIDEEGYLYLTGRKQPLEMLSTGHKIIPSIIENALMTSPFIAQAAVFGDGRPYVSALIVPDLEAFSSYFQIDEGDEAEIQIIPPDPTPLRWIWPREDAPTEPMITEAHPKIKIFLDKVIGEINAQLDRWEQIEQYSLIDQAQSITASQMATLAKEDRQQLRARYARHIEMMYPTSTPVPAEEVTQVEVTPERMRDLLEKENILDAWIADAGIEFLLELAEQKQIDAPSIVHVCDVAATIAQMENEERPLSTALIVGDQGSISRVLPPSQVHLMRHDHIRRMRGVITTLARVVDGVVLGYALDKHGYVRGIHKLDVDLKEDEATMLWGPQFRRHAAISQECQAMVFFVPAGGRQVRVFADGHLVGRYANGDWSQDWMAYMDHRVSDLVEQKGYDLTLIRRVLGCAFQMAERNLGAIFIIGEADRVLNHADTSEISHSVWISGADIRHMSDLEIINFAKEDGATLIDREGKFRNCMVLLRPKADTPAEIGPGKGARHSSAAKMSAEAQCLAIAVSQDGPITIYEGGRRVLSV